MKYREMRAAHEFGKMPHEFYAMPRWSQAKAIAFYEAKQKVEQYFMED